MFETGPLFKATLESRAAIVNHQGGTSSGKTYSIMQYLFFRALAKNVIITVTGESIPNLKKGAYRDAETIYASSPVLQARIVSWNKSDRIITFDNGSIMEFTSNLTEQSAKSGKRDFLFVNEANGITWAIFWQLAVRTRVQTIIDYNPTVKFWAHENLIGTGPDTNDLGATVETIISDHRHNLFLSEAEHKRIEGIKDKELWKVYARGITGNITGLVFPNWQRINDDLYPWNDDFFGGLDFGYTNDPTAGVKIVKKAESIFLHELCYTPGIAPITTKQLFWANGFTSEIPVYCDHDPDQIGQLRRLEMLAMPFVKGPGSVNSGILQMKEFKVFYTASSINLHEEKGKYSFVIDKATGKVINTPIDQFNHLMDASRGAVHTHFFRDRG